MALATGRRATGRCLQCGQLIAYFAESTSTDAPRARRMVYDPAPGQKYGQPHYRTGLCTPCRKRIYGD